MEISSVTKKYVVLIIITLGVIFFTFSQIALAQTVTTSKQTVELGITAPNFITTIQVATNPSFSNAQTFSAGPSVFFNLCSGAPSCTGGTKVLYVRYLDNTGASRYETTRTVLYNKPVPVVVEPAPEPVVPDPQVRENTSEPVEEPFMVEEELPGEVPLLEETPGQLKSGLRDWTASRGGVITTVAVAITSIVAVMGASAVSVFGSSFSFSQIATFPVRVWNFLLVLLDIRRRSQPWGVVYDSRTKQPLDPVYVQLLNEQGEEVATSLTDLYGRFGFLIEKTGRYRLQAGKTNYVFPSEFMKNVQQDVLYDQIYYGDILELEEGGVVTKNIPMDAQGEDWNQSEKKRMRVAGTSKLVAVVSQILFYGGLLFSIVMTVLSPTKANIIFLGIYVLVQLLRFVGFRPRAYGVITKQKTNEPFAHAIVKIFNAALNHRVGQAVADDRGHYYVLVSPGTYYMTVHESSSEKDAEPYYTSKPFIAQRGIVNSSIEI